jgi:predicted  nucleic acid-binding Zn-ribbon protein
MAELRHLYQLQELDLEIEAEEKKLQEKLSLRKESDELIAAQAGLTSAQQRLDELKKQQKSAEWQADDITSKIKTVEDQLYGGKVRNPKELESLHLEAELLKKKRDELETSLLELMDRVESAQKEMTKASHEFKMVETKWQNEQKRLAEEIEALKEKSARLKQSRQALAGVLDARILDLYSRLRKHKGYAIVKVEQGICRGCRISLPSSDLQQARSGHLVHCSSCGRILFLP